MKIKVGLLMLIKMNGIIFDIQDVKVHKTRDGKITLSKLREGQRYCFCFLEEIQTEHSVLLMEKITDELELHPNNLLNVDWLLESIIEEVKEDFAL